MSDTPQEEEFVMYNGVHAGTMYRFTDLIRCDIWAFEERMRIRLKLMGFTEDESEPNTYWLQMKEPTND